MIQIHSLLNNRINWKRHLIIWILITAYISIVDPVRGSLSVQILSTFFLMSTNIFVFYSVSLFVFPRFWNKNYFLFSLFIIVTFLLFTLFDFLNFRYIFPAFGGTDYYKSYSLTRIFSKSLYTFSFVSIPATAYFFSNLSLDKIKIQSEIEKSLILRELNFLKNQFNSHITFNFLNYCYSNIYQTSPKTADAIELFSSMLRYSLEVRPDQKVTLEKEIDYIDNFIKLQTLLTTKICVRFNYNGELKNTIILSRILATFVENAFKHGQVNNLANPITIDIIGDGSSVILKVKNKKNLKKNSVNTGIGQENVNKILELYYYNKYDLKIDSDDDSYSCELKIRLHEEN